MAKESRPRRSVQDLLEDQLARFPEAALLQPPEFRRGHERWYLLWQSTLSLLEAQAPQAYALVMAKLERHGLAGRELVLGGSVPHVWERLALAAGVMDAEPSARILEAVRAYARDGTPVRATGRRRRLRPRILLVIAYLGARWKIQNETAGQPRRRGESTEDRAVELVAQRYRLDPDSARVLIRRARARLAPALREWIESTAKMPAVVKDGRTLTPPGGKILWQVAMECELKS